MRYRIAREGVITVIGNYFEPGSIKWDPEDLLIVESDRSGSGEIELNHTIGVANDLRREEDGWITAEIVWTNPFQEVGVALIGKSLHLTIFGGSVLESEPINGTIRVIENVKLKSLFLTALKSPWEAA